ncbi:MAG: hypothetical protein K2P78_06620 [Gemmataceae bacterium]|nr:hypothetical protein [Gemmataceae bacterium]
MRLYHFTADRFLPGIREHGITRGVTPVRVGGMLGFISRTQWLTANAGFEQSWCSHSTLPYDRTERRITVEIPRNHPGELMGWFEFRKRVVKHLLSDFDRYGDRHNWWVFLGHIPAAWIIQIDNKPAAIGEGA